MRWQLERRLILAGFVAAALTLAFVGWESYRHTVQVVVAANERKLSYEIQLTLDEMGARLVDAETGQRGYLLTGDEAYLEPYRGAIKNLDQVMGQLKTLTSGDPNQQKHLQTLEPLIEKKLAELQETIDLRRKEGLAAANHMVVTGQGKQWMDQIRVVLGEMRAEGNDLRRIRTQQMKEVLTGTSRLVGVGNFLSISLLFLVFAILLRELSERKKAQEALARSERWFSTTLASIGDAVIATDMNGAVTFMNSAAQSLTGWTHAEATGKSMDLVFDIVNKETRHPVENPVKKVFREGKVVGLADHTLLLSKDGNEFDIEDSAAPILTDTGEGFGVVLVFRDITEKKRAEAETKRQKELLQLILESIADGVVVADSNGKFLLFNAAAEQVVGIGATDATPDQWSDRYGSYLPDAVTLYPPDELPLVRAMRGESVDAVEVFIRNAKVPDGRLLSVTGRALRGEDGALQGGVVVFQDITERKRAEAALRQSEERYHLLFDSNPQPVWVYDVKSLAILDVNQSAVRNYGYSREEFLSLTIRDIRPPEDVPALLESAENAPPDTEISGGWQHRKKDGSLIDVEITSHPLVYEGRDARLVVAADITTRKKAEEALQQSEKRTRLVIETSYDSFISIDAEGLITEWNHQAELAFGWSREEAVGKLLADLIVPRQYREAHSRGLKHFLATGEGPVLNKRIELAALRRDGHEFPIEMTISPLRFGQTHIFNAFVHDISERKKAEEELRRSEEHFRLIIESVVDYAILMLDPEGHVVSWNDGAKRIKGYSPEEILGKHFSAFYPPEDIERGKPQHELEVAIAEGRFEDEGLRVRKDGSTFWANVVITPLRTESGALRGFAKVTRDITRRKLKDEALVGAKEEAERANKFKDQFLSTMSHELRTPLNAILGFSELLRDPRYGPLNDRQARFTGHIHTGGEHLLSLINDILDLSKIEAGRLELAIESLPVEQAFGEVLDTLSPLAEKKRLALSQRCEAGLNVLADATRFKQVLVNLVGNALKFTPEGGSVELLALSKDGQVRVEVHDTGPGIPEEEQKRIFEAFYRAKQSGGSAEGTGLGLAITQRLLELHGGKLELTSQPGQGSCFYFSLPAARRIPLPPPSGGEDTVRRTGDAPRILIVEDDAVTVQLIKSQLTSSGYEVMVCDEPQRALAIAAAFQPDAITLDLLMKPTSGWEILLQLKNQSSTANIPVIVISIVDQRAGGILLGAEEFLIKPVNKPVLLAAVERCLAAHGGKAVARPILVVEDDAAAREVIVEVLTSEGYAVMTAADGAQARVLVATSLPELVILDLMLPKVSGFELIADWRSNPRTADLPVFVLTSKDLSKEEEGYIRLHSEYLYRKQDPWQESLARQLRRVVPHGQVERV